MHMNVVSYMPTVKFGFY